MTTTILHPAAAADAGVDDRAAFILRTYLHLLGAVFAFVVLEVLLLQSPIARWLLDLVRDGGWQGVAVLGAAIGAGWLARRQAARATLLPLQYLGLVLSVVFAAFVFLPLLYFVQKMAPDLLLTAVLVTIVTFLGLTGFVFVTRRRFNLLGGVLGVAGVVALALMLGGALFGYTIGLWFSVGMIAWAAGHIVWDTSRVLHDYRTDQHVSAALALFASVAMLFWSVLRLLMRRR